MKIAVVFYSMSGNTEYIASAVANETGADLIKIEPVVPYPDKGFKMFFHGGRGAIFGETPKLKEYEFDAQKYDLIVFGTPIWAGNATPPVHTFMEDNKNALKGKKTAVFTCSSGGSAEKAVRKMAGYLGIEKFDAVLSTKDPKVKNLPEDREKAKEFCKSLIKLTNN